MKIDDAIRALAAEIHDEDKWMLDSVERALAERRSGIQPEAVDPTEGECSRCRFFINLNCRRFPPGIGRDGWPSPLPEDWCGEYEAKEGAA